MSELAKALLAFQADAPTIQKDAINPHFRSKFVSLHALMEVVLPALNKHGVILMQLPTVVNGYGPALRTVLTHAETGESVEDVMPLQAAKNDPQGQGSALTYARRYALMAALGLVADEDDDGNAAQNRGREPARSRDEAGSTPAPDNPADAARAAQEAAKEARTPTDDGHPSEVVVHFGKNGPGPDNPRGDLAGTKLGDLLPKQLAWYADTWEPKNDPRDRRLKLAAQALKKGGEVDNFWDVPFG